MDRASTEPVPDGPVATDGTVVAELSRRHLLLSVSALAVTAGTAVAAEERGVPFDDGTWFDDGTGWVD